MFQKLVLPTRLASRLNTLWPWPNRIPFAQRLVSRLSSLYEVVLGATFIPFLLFFMLAAKRQVWHATMQLFPATERTLVKETLTDISLVLRSYVVGTAMVGVILVVLSWLFFLLDWT